MFCKICGRAVLSRNKYDIIHNQLVCVGCIEEHALTQETELTFLESITPKKQSNRRSSLPMIINIIAGIYLFYSLMIFDNYRYGSGMLTLFEKVILFIILISFAKIIRLLEDIKEGK